MLTAMEEKADQLDGGDNSNDSFILDSAGSADSAAALRWYVSAQSELGRRVKKAGSLSAAAREGVIDEGCLCVAMAELVALEGRDPQILSRAMRKCLNPLRTFDGMVEANPPRNVTCAALADLRFLAAVFLSCPSSNAGQERVFSLATAMSVSVACPDRVEAFCERAMCKAALHMGLL